MNYVMKNLWDNSKIYKFDMFKDQTKWSRDHNLNCNYVPEDSQSKVIQKDESEYKDILDFNSSNKEDDLLINSIRQKEIDGISQNRFNKRIFKMNRK